MAEHRKILISHPDTGMEEWEALRGTSDDRVAYSGTES